MGLHFLCLYTCHWQIITIPVLDTGQQLPASFMDNWLIQLIHVTSAFKTCFQVFWESLDELVLMIFFIYTKTLNNELLDDLGMWKCFCSSLLTFEKKKFFTTNRWWKETHVSKAYHSSCFAFNCFRISPVSSMVCFPCFLFPSYFSIAEKWMTLICEARI